MLYILSGAKPKTLDEATKKQLKNLRCTPKFIRFEEGKLPNLPTGSVCLAMGAPFLDLLKKEGVAHKGKTLGSQRETVFDIKGSKYLITYDPFTAITNPSIEVKFTWDIKLAYRLYTTGTTTPKLGNYSWVDSLQFIIKDLKALHTSAGKGVPVYCDTETVGLNCYNDEAFIVSLQIAYRDTNNELRGYALRFRGHDDQPSLEGSAALSDLWKDINWLLTSDTVKIIGANFKYDMRWILEKWGIYCENLAFDTTIVGSLLNENISNSLETHAKLYTDMGGYDSTMNGKYDKGRMDLVPDQDLLTYAVGDVVAGYQVYESMKSEILNDPLLTRFYVELLHKSSNTFLDLEHEGVLLDVDYQDSLKKDLTVEVKDLTAELINLLPMKIKLKYADNLTLRPIVLRDFFFGARGLGLKPKVVTAKTKEPSTAMAHLEMFEEVEGASEFVATLKRVGSAKKTLSTYVTGFNKHLQSDGRLHSTYMLHKGDFNGSSDSGTDTGRSSAKCPAIQTVPKHTAWATRLRGAYIAPKGMSILSCDYSAGEMRVAAVLANERNMIKAFNAGVDIHSATASGLKGLSLEVFMTYKESEDAALKKSFKVGRQGAKAANFGLLYGMSAGGYQAYAAASYGRIMSLEEAAGEREAFLNETYPALPKWHEQTKAFAHRHGYVRSPLGRIRHLPLINSFDSEVRAKAERNAVNSSVQGTLSDLTQFALIRVKEKYGFDVIKPMMMVHDDLKFYVPTADAELWAKRVCYEMANLPLKEIFGWDCPLTFEADAEIGENLAKMVELNL